MMCVRHYINKRSVIKTVQFVVCVSFTYTVFFHSHYDHQVILNFAAVIKWCKLLKINLDLPNNRPHPNPKLSRDLHFPIKAAQPFR